jgi:D-alanyl-D-alanine carboxypeptidase
MARLAYALRRDFPQYYHFFSERSFSYGGTTYRTHNSLVGNVRGIDGLKTGYIRASGFNIAVSGRREDDSLVAIVMGGATGAVRDAHARELVEAAFGAMAARRDGVILASLDSPRLNPIREQEILVAEARHLPQPAAMGSIEGAPPLQVVLQDTPDMVRPAREEDRPIPLAETFPAVYSEPIAPPASPGRDEALDSPGLPQPQQRSAIAQFPADAVPAGWSVQVGAFSSQAAAQARLESVAAMAPQLRGARPVTDLLDRDGRTLHRARFEALDAADARAACEALSRLGEACFAVSPNA